MKKTIDLLNEVVEMGFDRENALTEIDAAIDSDIKEKVLKMLPDAWDFFEDLDCSEGLDDLIATGRADIGKEEISDELYEAILLGFKCQAEGC